jgi:hypothetical protein
VSTPRARVSRALAAAAATVLIAACGLNDSDGGAEPDPVAGSRTPSAAGSATPDPGPDAGTDAGTDDGAGHSGHSGSPAGARPLRPGEQRLTLKMPEPYTPSAPTGVGTDDYRCFLLDPKLARDVFLTGFNILPGNPDVVHHVILFRVPPDQVARARTLDAAETGQGWTCFGDVGVDDGPRLDDAPWLGAWAPGGTESVTTAGFGTRMAKGSRIVMQVHYNLLAGASPDVSATQLRTMPASAGLTPLETMLLPAPVELPCRPGHTGSRLCDREASVLDVKTRFGAEAGATNDLLYFLCGGRPRAGETTSCTQTISRPTTIRSVAGHMHLLGRSIRIEVNPGTPRARTVLDIPTWDFDDQGATPIDPVRLQPSDTVKVTCRHVQWLRDELPSFEGQPDKYVVWGEGTTDEMCLGILTVTRP